MQTHTKRNYIITQGQRACAAAVHKLQTRICAGFLCATTPHISTYTHSKHKYALF